MGPLASSVPLVRARLAGSPARHRLARAIPLSGLLALVVWQATRSTALDEARQAYRRHDLPQTLQKALDHLARRPFSHDAAVLAARCLSELDYADAAEPYYRRAAWCGGLTLDDLHRQALGIVRSNQRQRAIAAYGRILRDRPNDVLALRRLATVYYSMQGYEQVRALAQKLIDLPGGAEVGYTLLGTVDHEQRERRRAIRNYEKVLTLDPRLANLPIPVTLFWTELSDDLIAEGRAEEARAHLIDALGRRDDAMLHLLRGKAEKALGLAEDAEASCRRALRRDAELRGAWLLLGQLAQASHKPRDAVEFLNRALALGPDDFETMYALSRAYRAAGDVDAAARTTAKVERLRARLKAPATGMGAP